MVDGDLVEDKEDDGETSEDDSETGTNTCCGWCRQTKKQQNRHDDLSEMVILKASEVSGGKS